MPQQLTILGIDPGTVIMGYSVISCSGSQVQILDMGVLKLARQQNHYERLLLIQKQVSSLIQQYTPTELAIEAPFQGKNIQSMLKLGRAQGAAIVCAMQAGMQVMEYSPKKVKQSVTGNGNASKQLVWLMLERLLQLPAKPEYYDATDALAVAFCHYLTRNPENAVASRHTSKKKSGKKAWKAFLAEHPDRIVS
ncbi:MAG: crossover junction endodeoxyribonuclease RuvC [Thermoflavifilum sp.]|nr:crossover junction endodeoxyribonuclease RuvC [Thermoflavifilum sp.]